MDRFITVLCDQDLTALLKPGKTFEPSDELLADIWAGIFLEYLDASGDNTTRHKINLARDIAILTARLSQIESLVLILRTMRHEEAIQLLQAKGNQDLSFPKDQNQYTADVNMAWDRSRETKIDLELLIIEKTELEEEEKRVKEAELAAGIPQKKADRSHFLSILARLATHKSVAVIRTSEITVAEFCAMFREYLDHIKALAEANRRKNVR